MFNEKKYLVIGGGGLVGGAFACTVAKAGGTVVVVDLEEKLAGNTLPKNIKTIAADILSPGTLNQILQDEQPSVILNTVNLATIFSANRGEGYENLVAFYCKLYEALANMKTGVHYIQVGTTGSGGLGFDIPFTHGENIEQRPIVHKAAFSGVTSQLLTMLSRSFSKNNVLVSEIKPGLAIFDEVIYERTISGSTLITLDGGESGHYTYNELALLMKMMGFTTAQLVVEKIVGILKGDRSIVYTNSYDLTAAMNRAIISEGRVDLAKRKKILESLKKQQRKHNIIATGNLGPRQTTAALVLAYMRLHEVTLHNPDASVRATLVCLAQKDIALAEYVESVCAKVPPFKPQRGITEPWQLVDMHASHETF
jgi:hypothetical protein